MIRRLTQLQHPRYGRRVARVDEPQLIFLTGPVSVYELAWMAIRNDTTLTEQIDACTSGETVDYESIYAGTSEWKLLPSFDHPEDVNRCMVSGTGLTHLASAQNRQAMHDAGAQAALTDSMKMYQLGEEGGRPAAGQAGVQPEWFYKGNGSVLRAHGAALEIPAYANDGGEEPEVAGAYLVDAQGTPRRIGFTTGNEFSDHVMEKKNYLYLAPSKIRSCAIGPELVVTDTFGAIEGEVQIIRNQQPVWRKAIATGEANMAHSLANLEYHHFKYANHRVPGQAHLHFYGADAFSFGENVRLQGGDYMEVRWEGMGRPLSNPLRQNTADAGFFRVAAL